jgi:UDP-N-acetyl-D-mannosaminuronic acid dehydrogenase
MKRIQLTAPIENLWQLLTETSEDANRIVCVFNSSKLHGIITDSEIRKFVALNRKLPTELSQILRTDFIHVTNEIDSLQMAESIAGQLEKKNYSMPNAINEVLVVSEEKVNLVPLSEFQNDINICRDRFVVIGLGYVGLTLFAVLFSKISHKRVFGVESDQLKLEKLIKKDFYILEPGLRDRLEDLNQANLFKSLSEIRLNRDGSIGKSIYFVSVQTPVSPDGSTSLEAILSVANDISKNLQRGDVVIIRSTVPIGTSRWVAKKIENLTNLKCGIDFYLGFAPERTVEGDAIKEIEGLPQIISGYSNSCVVKIREVVQRWTVSIAAASSLEAAEMIKLSNNAYRDHHFAFANELSMIANTHNVDINEVIALANSGYLRSNIPLPSAGVGGPCLSKDSKILLSEKITEETQARVCLDSGMFELSTILSARLVNEQMPAYFAELISSELTPTSVGVILGMTFKGSPPTNDLRNSPSVQLFNELVKKGACLYCWDSDVSGEELSELGYRSFQGSLIDEKTFPSFSIIGNNHNQNVIELKRLSEKYRSIKMVFDPWDLIRTQGEISFFRSKKIEVRTLSTLL